MANVKSYAWSKRLDAEVEDTTTTDVMTPGFTDPASYKTDETELVLEGSVLTPEQASSAWASDFSKVTVTNSSGDGWAPGQTLYVTVAGSEFDPANAQASFDALEMRVTNVESSVSTLSNRITALEGTVTDLGSRMTTAESNISGLDARVTALEGAAPLSAADDLKIRHAAGSAPSEEAQKAADAEKHEGEKHDGDENEKHGKHHKKSK